QKATQFAHDSGPLTPQSLERLWGFVGSLDPSTWQPAGASARVPVFLVGFPRSGTTLLDQILASHPQVTTLEERDTLVDAVGLLMRPGFGLEQWAALPDGTIEALRERYWQHVAAGLLGAPM